MTLTSQEVEALGTRGFFVRDSFLGPVLAARARSFAETRHLAGSFRPAGIRRGGDHTLDATVRSDAITWITEADLPELWSRFDELRVQVNATAWLGLQRFDLQLARYGGDGAHYARHRDAFPGDDNRRLTAIVYLNPAWRPEHGGQLVLHVDPLQTIEPVSDRLVVFLSEQIEHEVLPSFAERFAAAAWFYARPA